MIFYTNTLEVTQEQFDSSQEDIKNKIRQLLTERKRDLLKSFPLTKVDFVVPIKGELKRQYQFLFRKTTEEENDVLFAELTVNIEIVDEPKEK